MRSSTQYGTEGHSAAAKTEYDIPCNTIGTSGLIVVNASIKCTAIKTIGDMVAITARRPYRSMKMPRKGEMQAEIRYGMLTILAASLMASLNWLQYLCGSNKTVSQYAAPSHSYKPFAPHLTPISFTFASQPAPVVAHHPSGWLLLVAPMHCILTDVPRTVGKDPVSVSTFKMLSCAASSAVHSVGLTTPL